MKIRGDSQYVYEDDEDNEINILYRLLHYADSEPFFKTDFIDSVHGVLEKTGKITRCQMDVLHSIYEDLVKKGKLEDIDTY